MTKIEKTRLRLGLTQGEFAYVLGLNSFARISEYENGKQKPSLSVQILIELLGRGQVTYEKLKEIRKEIGK